MSFQEFPAISRWAVLACVLVFLNVACNIEAPPSGHDLLEEVFGPVVLPEGAAVQGASFRGIDTIVWIRLESMESKSAVELVTGVGLEKTSCLDLPAWLAHPDQSVVGAFSPGWEFPETSGVLCFKDTLDQGTFQWSRYGVIDPVSMETYIAAATFPAEK